MAWVHAYLYRHLVAREFLPPCVQVLITIDIKSLLIPNICSKCQCISILMFQAGTITGRKKAAWIIEFPMKSNSKNSSTHCLPSCKMLWRITKFVISRTDTGISANENNLSVFFLYRWYLWACYSAFVASIAFLLIYDIVVGTSRQAAV